MQLLIDRDNGAVTLNGTTHIVDCSSIPSEVIHVRWYDDHGGIYYRDGRTTGLSDIRRFKAIVDAWHDKQNACG